MVAQLFLVPKMEDTSQVSPVIRSNILTIKMIFVVVDLIFILKNLMMYQRQARIDIPHAI
jgi:hypothetical protein